MNAREMTGGTGAPDARGPGPAGSPVKVLLVDDRPGNLLALEQALGPLELDLVRALSGDEALHHLLAEDFAAILLDVQMPGMDGYQTAEAIRSRDRDRVTPILFLTAHPTSEPQVFRGYESGAVDFLIRPVAPEVLRAKVALFAAKARLEAELRGQAETLSVQDRTIRDLNERLAGKVAELEAALAKVRHLEGILPICAYCKKIRTDTQIWQQMEQYITEHSTAVFSHGICPDCREAHFPHAHPDRTDPHP